MKAAIVGCGHIAEQHIKALRSIPNVDVVAVVDKNEKLSADFARRYGVAFNGGDVEQMLQTTAPDVVHILTPPQTHYLLGVAVLNAGCHALIEKPLTVSVKDSEELAIMEEASSGTISVCHNFLYVPAFRKALKLIHSGAIGEVESSEVYWRVSAGGPSKRYQDIDWVTDLPGGIYSEVGAHPLYLLRAVLGQLEVTGGDVLGEPNQGVGGAKQLRVLLRSTSGLGAVTISTSAMPVEKHIRISGSKMSLLVDLGTNMLITRRALGFSIPGRTILNLEYALQLAVKTTSNIVLTLIGKMPRSHVIFLREYYARLAAGLPPEVTLADGLDTVRLLDAIWSRLSRTE